MFAIATRQPVPPTKAPGSKATRTFQPSRIHCHVAKPRGFFVTEIVFRIDREISTGYRQEPVRRRNSYSFKPLHKVIDAVPLPIHIREIKLARIHIDEPIRTQYERV